MSDQTQALTESKVAESANAAAVAQEATHNAFNAQISEAVENSIAKFFDRGVQEKKFIDVGRIPFICDDIKGLHEETKEINASIKEIKQSAVTKEDFLLIRNIVFSFIGLIVFGFMGTLFTIVFK